MGFAEKRGSGKGTYYRARYKAAPGSYLTLPEKYATKRDAKQAADAEEARLRIGQPRRVTEDMTFGVYANRWYAGLSLAPSTMANYRRHLEQHLLPTWEDVLLRDMLPADIDAWELAERAAGYKAASVKTWRATLHAVLAAAADAHLIDANPVTRRRGTGRRAGRSADRGPERAIVDPLGALLLAERLSILSGRDDEFVMCITMAYTGMRFGEVVGLEREFFRLATIRVEWQLYELASELSKCPPKDDSYRDVDLPPFLSELISGHITRTGLRPCSCHGKAYVFRGLGRARGTRSSGVTLRDVAQEAGVSGATVSNVLNHDTSVAEETRRNVEAVIARLGYVRTAAAGAPAPHWRRSGFEAMFTAAGSGWFPARRPQPRRPVPLLAEPWPGIRVHGRNSQGRAEMAWLPIAAGLTPHGLRHSHKSLMSELRTPEVYSHERLGHELGGIAGRYSHVTVPMRDELMKQLTESWEQAVDARRSLNPRSPVAVLDALLRTRATGRATKIFSQDSPDRGPEGVIPLRARPRKGA